MSGSLGRVALVLISLARYVRDILTRTPETLDQVTIAPDGNWIAQEMRPVAEPRPNVGSVVEVEDISLSEDEAPPARPGPSADVAPPSSASKRKAAEVIDLTLDSSDEDDEPLTRPAKRPYQSMDEPQPQTYTFPSAW